jgi:hypothetical protein
LRPSSVRLGTATEGDLLAALVRLPPARREEITAPISVISERCRVRAEPGVFGGRVLGVVELLAVPLLRSVDRPVTRAAGGGALIS